LSSVQRGDEDQKEQPLHNKPLVPTAKIAARFGFPPVGRRRLSRGITWQPNPRHFLDENMQKSRASQDQSAAELISKRIAELGDWRGETLGRMRKLIKEANPDVIEEWKWSVPVLSHGGIICTGESYKDKVKLTFAKGASLKDPAHLFNSSLDGNVRRAIDIHEGEEVVDSAFKALVRQAIVLNSSGKSKAAKKA
jgi:hypothetical protein